MDILKVRGNIPLKGTVRAMGAKNAITKMLVASLISDKRCVFYHVPDIEEVYITLSLCQEIGMEASWDRDAQMLEVETKELKTTYIPQRFSQANRIPILMLGALLGRTDENIVVPTLGGCKIGKRPVDFHIQALQLLGATVEYREMKKDGAYFAQAIHGLRGNIIHLPYPSVGATENTILAACRAKGTTVIHNAAIEPEVLDFILFLQKLGVHIHVDVNRTIVIHRTTKFYEVEHDVIPDRIEIASMAMAAIATKGCVFVEGARQDHLVTFLNKLREVNGGFTVSRNGISFFYQGPLHGGIHIETDVHPGFLTDWQQPFVTLLTQAHGSSVIHETVYENRFGYTETLRAMGADVNVFSACLGGKICRFAEQNYAHSLIIKGPTPLSGKKITIPDLRAGFAYLMAALISSDTSEISNLHFLDRGYEKVDIKLASLGADIQRLTVNQKEWEKVLG